MKGTPPISPLFLKLRAWAFGAHIQHTFTRVCRCQNTSTGIISLLSFAWITLLSVVAYTRFTLSSRPERSYTLTYSYSASHSSLSETFIVVIILINLLTVILLPIMFVFLAPHTPPNKVHHRDRLLVRFRSWLDAVRMVTLLTCHIGTVIYLRECIRPTVVDIAPDRYRCCICRLASKVTMPIIEWGRRGRLRARQHIHLGRNVDYPGTP